MIIHEGDTISIDGNTGKVYLGLIPTIDPGYPRSLAAATAVLGR